MSVTWSASTGVSTTGAARGTTSTTVTYVGVAAGRRAFLTVGAKPSTATINTPSGWTKIGEATGGTGSTGTADVGPTKVAMFYQDLTGSESGSVTVTGSSTTSIQASMDTAAKTRAAWAPPVMVSGNDSTHGTGISAVCGTWSDGGLKVGDHVLVGHSGDTDDSTTATSAPVITQSGITFGTAAGRSQLRNTSGFQGMTYTWSNNVTAVTTRGTSNAAAPTVGFTWSVSSCGPVMAVRVRDMDYINAQSDNFDDGTINTALWASNYGDAGGQRESGGRGQIDANSTQYNAFSTSGDYAFQDGTRIWLQLFPETANGATSEAYQELSLAPITQVAGTELTFYIDRVTNIVYCLNRVAYSDASPVSFAYNASSHAYMGWLRSGSSILFQTSPDATNWTTQRTLTNPSWLPTTASDLYVFSEAHRGDGTANVAEIDNFNVVGAAATSPVSGSLTASWTTLQSVTGSSSALWTTYQGVTGSASALWTTLQAVTGGSDLRWTTLQAVSSSLSALWTTRVNVSGSNDFRWTVTGMVSGTLDLRWTTLSIVAGALDLRWAVTSPVSSGVDLRWSVLAGVTGSANLLWTTNQQVTGSSSLLWTTRQNVAGSLTAQWLTRVNVSGATSLLWTTLQGTGNNITALWTTRQNVSGNVEFDWNTLASVSGYVDLWYTTLASVTGQANLLWVNNARVTGSSDLRWTVNGSNIAISGSLDLRWLTNAGVSGSISLPWATRANVAGSLDARWTTLAALSGSVGLPWTVLAPVGGSASMPWTVRNAVSGSVSLTWAQFASVAGSLSLLWGTAGKVSGSTALQWTVRNAVAGTLTLPWTVRSQIAGSLGLTWQVSARVVGSTQLLWIVTAAPLPDQPQPADVRVRLTDRFTAYPEQLTVQYGPTPRVPVDLSEVL